MIAIIIPNNIASILINGLLCIVILIVISVIVEKTVLRW